MTKSSNGKRGSSLPETALVMVVLLMLTFGIIDFGRAIYTYTFLTNVAQKAVRWTIVRGSNCNMLDHCNTDGPPADPAGQDIANWIRSQDFGIVDPAKMAISGDFGLGNHPGDLVVVYIVYPFNFMLPFMPRAGINFRVAARMRMVN